MRGRFITLRAAKARANRPHATLLASPHGGGIHVLLTRETGGSSRAEAIRHVLLSGVAEPLGVEAEATAVRRFCRQRPRAQHDRAGAGAGHLGVKRSLHRSTESPGHPRSSRSAFIRGLERVTVGDLNPDYVILDVPAELGLARANKRRGEQAPDRFEGGIASLHEACARPIVSSWLPSRAAASRSMPPSQSLRL